MKTERGEEMEWNEILREYEQSRSAVSGKIQGAPPQEQAMLKKMVREMTEDIRYVKENSLRELRVFMDRHGREVLTARQFQVLTLRAKGLSMGKIAEELGISKTAVRKSICLSEKKIRLFTESEGGERSVENVS